MPKARRRERRSALRVLVDRFGEALEELLGPDEDDDDDDEGRGRRRRRRDDDDE